MVKSDARDSALNVTSPMMLPHAGECRAWVTGAMARVPTVPILAGRLLSPCAQRDLHRAGGATGLRPPCAEASRGAHAWAARVAAGPPDPVARALAALAAWCTAAGAHARCGCVVQASVACRGLGSRWALRDGRGGNEVLLLHKIVRGRAFSGAGAGGGAASSGGGRGAGGGGGAGARLGGDSGGAVLLGAVVASMVGGGAWYYHHHRTQGQQTGAPLGVGILGARPAGSPPRAGCANAHAEDVCTVGEALECAPFEHPLHARPAWVRCWVVLRRVCWLCCVFAPLAVLSAVLLVRPTPAARARWLEGLVAALESAGCSFQKFGQWMSMRPDMLPPDVIDALSKLRMDVPVHSMRHNQAVIRETTGAGIEDIFLFFDPRPIASGTVAQVHICTYIYM